MTTEHPGILYFYSESISLAANGCCALAAALSNFGVIQRGTSSIGLWFLIIGGIAQLLCALRAYRAHDHFGATAFAFYSTFWGVLGLEILLSASIDLLHICFVAVGVLFTLISPIVNGFYPIVLTSITVASCLELALRVDDSSPIQIAAAVSELCAFAVTGYGCVAALLHGNHERQVLPGFDDAIIETVLWKRDALKSTYSDGKYANPTPLGNICCSLGYAGLAFQYHGTVGQYGLTIWSATFAVLSCFVSLLHNLRHERLWSVSSICDACLFAVTATASGGDELGEVIAFAALRTFILGFAIAKEFSLMHIIAFIFQVASLLAIGVASFLSDSNAAEIGAIILGCITSVSSLYNGMAELTNSVAQKELLHTGQDWKFPSTVNESGAADEESGPPLLKNRRSNPIKQYSLDLTSRPIQLPSGSDEGDRNGAGLIATASRRLKSKFSYVNDDTSVDNSDNEVSCPGDNKLMGKSDFQSPLFVMTAGTAIYSLLMSTGAFANSSGAIFGAAVVILVAQSASLTICLSRGQTSYGFLCFTFLLEGMVLVNDFYSAANSTSLLGIIFTVQLMWLLTSFHVFRLLSIATIAHLFGLLFYITNGIAGDIQGLQYTAGVFFAMTSVIEVITLGILLFSDRSTFCRWVLQSSASETEERCEMGFASNREEFDRCIQILRDGGVCVIPTDTVYCLACAANNPDGIRRIYAIKNRPSEKPLSLWLGSIDDIRAVAPEGKCWTQKLFSFMDELWPGSVSLVVERGTWLKRMGVGDAADLIGTEDSIALRVPNSTLTVALLRETGPLAITSANPSGACDCTHHNKVDDVIASKIDYILADGPSPMTIASSVIDVRNIDDNELFFYRVGCVPEAYVWGKLNGLKEKSPPVLADIGNAKVSVIQSFMAQIIRLIGCDTYKMHMLIRAPQDKDHGMATTGWNDLSPRIKNAFVSGVSFYDDREEDAQSSEMITPLLNSHGEVCAVLQLLDKSVDGSTVQFKKDDMKYAGIVAPLLGDNLPSERSGEEIIDLNTSVTVLTLTEHGYRQRPSIIQAPGQVDLTRRSLLRSSRGPWKSMLNMGSMRELLTTEIPNQGLESEVTDSSGPPPRRRLSMRRSMRSTRGLTNSNRGLESEVTDSSRPPPQRRLSLRRGA